MRTRVCDRCDGEGKLPCSCPIEGVATLKIFYYKNKDYKAEKLFIGKCTSCGQLWKIFSTYDRLDVKHTYVEPGQSKNDISFPLDEAAKYQESNSGV